MCVCVCVRSYFITGPSGRRPLVVVSDSDFAQSAEIRGLYGKFILIPTLKIVLSFADELTFS